MITPALKEFIARIPKTETASPRRGRQRVPRPGN